MRRAIIACALLLGTAQCAHGELTELLLVVDTDLEVPSELTRVAFEVTGPRGDVQRASADFAAGEARPAVLALVHRGGPLGPLTIEVSGERGNERIVGRTARVHFVPGRVMTLRVWLTEACVDARCGEEETCGERGCRGIDVAAEELEPWNGPPGGDGGATTADAGAACGDRASCDDGLACTLDVCRDGECAHLPDSSACADDGLACTSALCDPERGCIHRGDDEACDDRLDCTEDRCDPELGCTSMPRDDACRDGRGCTDDRCDLTLGCTRIPDDARCDDGVGCTIERCDPDSGCESEVSHASCDPGDFCDPDDGCRSAPSFDEVYAFFERRCVSCHTADDPDGGLDLSTRTAAWASLVGVPSTCDSSTRVVPRDARASLLWRKVARVDLCRDRMPPSGPPTSDSDRRMIERWINGGASSD